tara:strand:- start:485 stop:1114 length:630 start_codon:yes stop_codon:yes gene_type:complete
MGLFNVFVAYKFIKLLVKPFKETEAYKLGLIDDKGRALKKKSDFTDKEKKAYSAVHELVWNIKRLLDKVPGLKSRLGSFAVALWLLKQKMSPDYQKEEVHAVESIIVEHADKMQKCDCDLNVMIMESILYSDTPSRGLYTVEDTDYCEMFDDVEMGDMFSYDGSESIGDGYGIRIYEAVHLPTGNKYPMASGILTPFNLKEVEQHETSV